MGCVESNEAPATDLADEVRPPAAAPAGEKGKQKKKYSIRSRRTAGKKESADSDHSKQRSESTKITVIWRRYSAFNRRDSMKSTKSQDTDSAGPSQKAPEEPEVESSNT